MSRGFRSGRANALLLGTLLASSALLAARPQRAVTHVVKLDRSRFDPAQVEARPGDTVRFLNGLGGPHNVQFMAESISIAAQGRLNAAMKDRILPLTSPMLLTEGESWEVVVPALPPGRYPFLCSPHWSTMRGALVIATPAVSKDPR